MPESTASKPIFVSSACISLEAAGLKGRFACRSDLSRDGSELVDIREENEALHSGDGPAVG